jgi:hypothetical protein
MTRKPHHLDGTVRIGSRQIDAPSAINHGEPGALPLPASGVSPNGPHIFAFAEQDNTFLLDNLPFQIRRGELHPARIPAEYWRHRIQMAKAMGMNTIALYVMCNYHETSPGAFGFESENRDVQRFISLVPGRSDVGLAATRPVCLR